jgi:hypothetical protein
LLQSSLIDVSHPENLHWLAFAGGSTVLSVASSIVPNYLESSLDIRAHNRSRLLNETAARTHIAYIIFLIALITSDDVDRANSVFAWVVTATVLIVFVLMLSVLVSGRTIDRINKYKEWNGTKHACNPSEKACTPIGLWLYFKVCWANTFLALTVGAFCLWLCVSPSIIKHGPPKPTESVLLKNQRKEYFDILRKVYDRIALQTRQEFESSVRKDNESHDPRLNISYWINYEGNLYQLGTTEEHFMDMSFPRDKTSIIGCAFTHQNHTVQWDDKGGKCWVLPFNDEPNFADDTCQYAKEEQRKLKSIVCTSYNANGPAETTVGICAFTESDTKVMVGNYHHFLKTKAEEFYKLISPALAKKYLVPATVSD